MFGTGMAGLITFIHAFRSSEQAAGGALCWEIVPQFDGRGRPSLHSKTDGDDFVMQTGAE
jgi:hypothetical protein